VAAATLLSPWRLKFAIDARELYQDLYPQASAEAETGALGWLADRWLQLSGATRRECTEVRAMSQLSGVLGVLMVVADPRLAGGAGGRLKAMAPKPLPPEQIKPLPTTIGIEEGRGGSRPRPNGDAESFAAAASTNGGPPVGRRA